jgi:FXSXX-COOH protein
MTDSVEKRSEYSSDVADVRQVPLADVPALAGDVRDRMLRRAVPEPASRQVPVASFNSSI